MTMVRVEDLAGAHEVAQILHLTDARVGQLRRSDPDFPQPVHTVAATPLYLIPDVIKYGRNRIKGKPGRPKGVNT